MSSEDKPAAENVASVSEGCCRQSRGKFKGSQMEGTDEASLR